MISRATRVVPAICRPPALAAVVRAGVLLALTWAPGTVHAQAPKPWRLFEADPATVKYRDDLRLGTFDDSSKDYLTRLAVPQLALEVNRPLIDRVRRRMRETLCGDASTDPRAAAAATDFVLRAMLAVAQDADAEPIVRVNAMLLVGELKGVDQKPWASAVGPLAEAVGDARLPMAVRIAAAAGLARQVAAAPKTAGPVAGPVVVKLLSDKAPDDDPVAADWLRERALSMLATLGPAAPREAVVSAVKLLDDASQPLDVRVRAAAAAGAAAAGAVGEADAGRLIDTIRGLAVLAVATETDEVDRLRVRQRLTGQPQVGGFVQGGGGPAADGTIAVMPLACRRAAWRFATLAAALAGDDAQRGLASVAGGRKGDAESLGETLRTAAARLDATPDEPTLLAELAKIRGGAAAPGGAPTPDAAPAPAPEPEPAKPADEASPFDNPFGQ